MHVDTVNMTKRPVCLSTHLCVYNIGITLQKDMCPALLSLFMRVLNLKLPLGCISFPQQQGVVEVYEMHDMFWAYFWHAFWFIYQFNYNMASHSHSFRYSDMNQHIQGTLWPQCISLKRLAIKLSYTFVFKPKEGDCFWLYLNIYIYICPPVGSIGGVSNQNL